MCLTVHYFIWSMTGVLHVTTFKYSLYVFDETILHLVLAMKFNCCIRFTQNSQSTPITNQICSRDSIQHVHTLCPFWVIIYKSYKLLKWSCFSPQHWESENNMCTFLITWPYNEKWLQCYIVSEICHVSSLNCHTVNDHWRNLQRSTYVPYIYIHSSFNAHRRRI